MVNTPSAPRSSLGWLIWVGAIIASCSSTPDDLFGDDAGGGRAGGGGGRAPGVAGGLANAGTGLTAGGDDAGGSGGADAGASGSDAGGATGGSSKGGSAGSRPRGGAAGTSMGGSGGTNGGSSNGGSTDAGAAGDSAGAPGCPANCDPNATCSEAGDTVTCTCNSGFVGDGTSCRRPRSCNELHLSQPDLASGERTLRGSTTGAEFRAYCEMSAEGGGWTLILNEGPTFDPATLGKADALCHTMNCTSLAYSEVLLESDVMLDMSDTAIAARAGYAARAVVLGVHPATRDKTLHTMFAGGSYFVDAEDNSNVTVRVPTNQTCDEALTGDIAGLLCTTCTGAEPCEAPVLVFGDRDSGCDPEQPAAFALGGAMSYSMPWTNCAGWPQTPDIGTNFYPDYFRIWIR